MAGSFASRPPTSGQFASSHGSSSRASLTRSSSCSHLGRGGFGAASPTAAHAGTQRQGWQGPSPDHGPGNGGADASNGSRTKVTVHVATLEAPPAAMADAKPSPAGRRRYAPAAPPRRGDSLPDLMAASLSDMTAGRVSRLPPRAPAPAREQQQQQRQPRRQWEALPELEILSDFAGDYELGDLLGRGTFGEVRAAEQRATGRRVAVKVLAKGGAGRNDMRAAVLAEVRGGGAKVAGVLGVSDC
jgi:hypothetical protein